MIVTRSMVHEVKIHKFVVGASDLGLRPGEWVNQLSTDMGNGRAFFLTNHTQDRDGDLVSVLYRQELGCITLEVLND